ncbi:MAG: hypothetical protein JJT93_02745 [Gammaproteobacteria bacterium]|nr:hypothetical protein [Gammaproteobacteria bacterium]
MKFVHLSFPFEYMDEIEALLDQHAIRNYARYPRVHGRDPRGKHFGTQVFPGNFTVVQALVEDEALPALMNALRAFRDAREAHRGTEAVVLPIEERL